MSLEILQNARIVSEGIDTLTKLSKGFQAFAPDLGPLGHEMMFAAAHLEHAILRFRRIQEAMATDVALAEQVMDEAQEGARVRVAGGVLQVGARRS